MFRYLHVWALSIKLAISFVDVGLDIRLYFTSREKSPMSCMECIGHEVAYIASNKKTNKKTVDSYPHQKNTRATLYRLM